MLNITIDQAYTIIEALDLAVEELTDRMCTDQRSIYPLYGDDDLTEIEQRQADMIQLTGIVADFIKGRG